MSWESCNFTRTTSEAYNIYMENPKITSAYLHILEAAGIFSESNEEVSRTLFELARWTKDEYGISDEQVKLFSGLVDKIRENVDDEEEKDEVHA